MNKQERRYRLIVKLESMGFSYKEVMALIKIAKCLRKWHMLQINGSIKRRDDGKMIRFYYTFDKAEQKKVEGESRPLRDLEKGALKKLGLIMKGKKGLVQYVKKDELQNCIYIVKASDVEGVSIANPIGNAYTQGTAIY